MLAVRAFDHDAMMVGWELVDGSELKASSSGFSPSARGLFARPLCGARLLCRAHRAGITRLLPGGFTQRGVDAVLPARPLGLKKIQHVAVDAQRNRFLQARYRGRGLGRPFDGFRRYRLESLFGRAAGVGCAASHGGDYSAGGSASASPIAFFPGTLELAFFAFEHPRAAEPRPRKLGFDY
jgi:hypothetical protein